MGDTTLGTESATIERCERALDRAMRQNSRERPFVTVSFAQSLDGSIAPAPGRCRQFSSNGSMAVTHNLRARHDAILVGINTVLVDDPLLTVRLAAGPDPRPIVLDSRLRFPLDRQLLAGDNGAPIIATTDQASSRHTKRLEAAGAEVVPMACTNTGLVDLHSLMSFLHGAGVRSLMVEGGARVITSFLREPLTDHLIVTIAPVLAAGVPSVTHAPRFGTGPLPHLSQPSYEALGDDLILTADIVPGS